MSTDRALGSKPVDGGVGYVRPLWPCIRWRGRTDDKLKCVQRLISMNVSTARRLCFILQAISMSSRNSIPSVPIRKSMVSVAVILSSSVIMMPFLRHIMSDSNIFLFCPQNLV